MFCLCGISRVVVQSSRETQQQAYGLVTPASSIVSAFQNDRELQSCDSYCTCCCTPFNLTAKESVSIESRLTYTWAAGVEIAFSDSSKVGLEMHYGSQANPSTSIASTETDACTRYSQMYPNSQNETVTIKVTCAHEDRNCFVYLKSHFVAKVKNGRSCAAGIEACSSDVCSDGVCGLANGEACVSDFDCASQICSGANGVCCTEQCAKDSTCTAGVCECNLGFYGDGIECMQESSAVRGGSQQGIGVSVLLLAAVLHCGGPLLSLIERRESAATSISGENKRRARKADVCTGVPASESAVCSFRGKGQKLQERILHCHRLHRDSRSQCVPALPVQPQESSSDSPQKQQGREDSTCPSTCPFLLEGKRKEDKKREARTFRDRKRETGPRPDGRRPSECVPDRLCSKENEQSRKAGCALKGIPELSKQERQSSTKRTRVIKRRGRSLWAGCYCSNACVSSIAFLCDIAAVVFYIVQIWLIAESGMARYAIGVIITAVLVALMFLYTAYLVYLIIALQCKGKKTHVKKDGGVKRAWEDVQNEGRGVAGAAKEQEQAAKQGAQKYGNDERNPIKGEYGQAEGQYDAQRNQYGQEATQYGNRTEGYAAEGQGYGNQAGDNADHYRGRAEEAV
uniref:Uncharacterized protein n=1 Tax=Chromera velia CCMP2878 TaxID=1169474 RepID=A0A0G4HTY3_9ALVE|eukprot:Cvel_8545.t1-p1 / transcript=Cvel_8545.t1 / gene=Cvel_8545 / organism=Chromera_velia_CCMP2878 / gene_product=hypothetical protein / transcript_product=hypothetical protein / location=Cvel_scaffold474:786-7114(+) / protein_length=627 / sequence_SO=supercontig / SO=protein_coding / is_pseudo=false